MSLRRAKQVALIAVLLLAVTGVYVGALLVTGNFHPVIAGELYRSGQPTVADLGRYQRAFGIRTIINLRGKNEGRGWYDAEIAAAAKLGIAHVDFGLSAREPLDQKHAGELIAVMAKAEKPILIHCLDGADRTGLAAALYLAAVKKAGEEAAERQMSIRYGHLSLPVVPAYAMDETFETLEPWLGYLRS